MNIVDIQVQHLLFILLFSCLETGSTSFLCDSRIMGNNCLKLKSSFGNSTAQPTKGNNMKSVSELNAMKESKDLEGFLPNLPSTNNIDKEAHTVSKETVGATRWLSLQTLDYTDEHGNARKWDLASRTTKKKNGVADAVVIVALLVSKLNSTKDTLLVEQYRPPVERKTLEFPAGLIDEGETATDAALRELYEETGYHGDRATSIESQELCMSPGLTDESISIVVTEVDLDDPKNANPKQHCDEGEIIHVKRVPFDLGMKEMMKAGGTMPISLLYSFILGMEMGMKYVKK